jgi:hypothetical protein
MQDGESGMGSVSLLRLFRLIAAVALLSLQFVSLKILGLRRMPCGGSFDGPCGSRQRS